MKRHLLILLTILLPVVAKAYTAEIDGIYYKFSGDKAEVTFCDNNFNSYNGNVVIPASVTYNNKTYSVTSIGNNAFRKCTGLISVTIPESVTSIGTYAFYICSSLTSINIPDNVTSIGVYAFAFCSSLTSINIPDNVTSIRSYTFSGCSGLTSITISKRVTSIGDAAFSGCSGLTSVIIPNSVTSIGIYAFQDCSSLTSVTIPEGVTSIGSQTFQSCIGLTSVTIPSSVTSIGDYAFSGCYFAENLFINNSTLTNSNNWGATICEEETNDGLLISDNTIVRCRPWATSITISEGVTSIGDEAFSGCSNLSSVTLESNAIVSASRTSLAPMGSIFGYQVKTYIIGDGVISIGNSAFYGCSSMTSITLPESLKNIGQSAFYGCSSLTSITIPDNVTSIGENAFTWCTGLTSITIPQSVCIIGDNAFSYCSNLYSINLLSDDADIGANAFSETSWYKTQPEGVIYLGNVAYEYKGEMPANTTIEIKDGTTRIASHVFYGSFNLVNINLPNSLKGIGASAFYGCSRLSSIVIPESTTKIGKYAFYNCEELTSIVIPDSVVSIGEYCFANCVNLESVTIGEKVSSDSNPFKGCNKVTSVRIKCEHVGDWFNGFTSINNITLDKSVRRVSANAFRDCTGLTELSLNEGLQSIGSCAFSNCENLSSVSFPSSLATIEESAFYNCKIIPNVIIPRNVTKIGYGAFAYCSNLSSIKIEEGNEKYDSRDNCNAIIEASESKVIAGCRNTIIPEGIKRIDGAAFSGCIGLVSITIPKSVYKIEYGAFRECSSLSSIKEDEENIWYDSRNDCNAIIETSKKTIIAGCMNTSFPEGVTRIAQYSFSGCSSLTSLNITKDINSIDEYAFNGCIGLTSITVDPDNTIYDSRDNCNAVIETNSNRLIVGCNNTKIPSNITSYGFYAFSNCTSLRLPDGMETTPFSGGMQCPFLETIILPNSIKMVEGLRGPLKRIIIEDGTEEITFRYTYGNSPLDSIYIGRNINYYNTNQTYYAPFRNSLTLRVVKFGNNVTNIPNYSFSGCTNLSDVMLTDSIKNIGSSAFSGCEKLDSIYLGSSLEVIGQSAFRQCTGLKKIVIPPSVKEIGNEAFSGCEKLDSIYLGSNLEVIGQSAFQLCTGLKKVVIPPSVKEIGSNAFFWLNLSTLILEDGEENLSFNDVGQRDETFMFDGNAIDTIYCGRSGAKINYKKINHLTLGNIKTLAAVNSDTINVLNISNSPDTLFFCDNQKYSYASYSYYYTMPFHGVIIDSVYCNRIIDVYDAYNLSNKPHPFDGVTSSFKLEIGKDLTEIGEYMFYGCQIPTLLIPKNIKRIAPTSFLAGTLLSSLTIEDSPEPLDFGTGGNFVGWQLRDVYIGRNMLYESNSPFVRNKEGIVSLAFGENVTDIPDKAFSGLKNLNQLRLPINLKKIGEMAFYGCDGLTALSIPGSVLEIGQQAYVLCRGLKSLTIEDGIDELTFTSESNSLNNSFCNSPLEEIYMGRDFSYTYSSPFFAMETLKTLTFSENVKTIGERAYAGCNGLEEVYCYAEDTPEIASNSFGGVNVSNVLLVVPDASVDKYKSHPIWKQFWVETPTDVRPMWVNKGISTEAYNISGQRLHSPKKGLNIINGQKILMR